MKKRAILIALSALLAVSVSLTAFAITMNIRKSELQGDTLDMGDSFMVSDTKPEAVSDDNAARAFDDDDATAWAAQKGGFAQLDFTEPTSINNVNLKESGSNVRKFHIEAWNGEEWVHVYNNDLIERYHLCALPSPIKTYALRVYIDDMNGASAQITTVEPVYQRPVELDNEFVNVAYMSGGTSYQHGGPDDWGAYPAERMASFTDVVLIKDFTFDNLGVPKITIPADGGKNDILDVDDQRAIDQVKQWLDWVDDWSGDNAGKPRVWLCFNNLKSGDNPCGGKVPQGFFDAATIEAFATSLADFAHTMGVYGVDIDLEHPYSNEEWAAYNNMMVKVGEKLHAKGLKLSTALTKWSKPSAAALNQIDRVNLMAYDALVRLPGGYVNHATFKDQADDAIKTVVNNWNYPREKLVLGLPWYTNRHKQNGDIEWDYQQGWKEMYNILLQETGEEDENGNVTIDAGVNFISGHSFNGPNLIRDKVAYSVKNKIGGVFCWHGGTDTEYDNPYSLARITRDTIDMYVAK